MSAERADAAKKSAANVSAAERHWRGRAGGVAWRVNLGWWWHQLAPGLVGVNLGGAAGLLLFRQMRWPMEIWAVSLGAGWLMAAGWAWWKARPHFYAVNEGLLRLETHLGWHNVLSSATAGVVGWPAPSTESVQALRWRWGPSAGPLAISLGFLLVGWLMPVGTPPKGVLPPPAQLPVAAQQVESWMETLKEQDLVEPAMLDTWQERLDELKKDPREWYGQQGLEASEALRDQMSQELNALGKNLQKASDLVGDLGSLPPAASTADLDAQMSQSLANLQNGGLPLKGSLAQALSSAAQLTPQQLAQLQQQLKNGAGVLGKMQGQGQGGLPGLQPGQMGSGGVGGNGSGRSGLHGYGTGNNTGSGGTGGGGGTAPMVYASDATDLNAQKTQGSSNTNMDAPVLGETLATLPGGAPKTADPDDTVAPGGAADAGNGGDAVWRQELTPDERAVLQQYFK
jgi:hypothetical protein